MHNGTNYKHTCMIGHQLFICNNQPFHTLYKILDFLKKKFIYIYSIQIIGPICNWAKLIIIIIIIHDFSFSVCVCVTSASNVNRLT